MANKLNILIDTNSLFHLSEVDIGKRGRKPTAWLWNYCNVYICEIIKVEFERNIAKIHKNSVNKTNAKATFRKIKQKGLSTKSRYIQQIERETVGRYVPPSSLNSSEDKGERHLICEAIEMVYYSKVSNCFIVSDDYTALQKFMRQAEDDYPFGTIWNVFDLIAYLFFAKKEVTYQQAEHAVRDLVALSSISVKKYRRRPGCQTEIEARQAMLKDYIAKLNNIKAFRDALPR
jgi:hypothetical protein